MKRAIFQKFILILSLALILSGSIFSVVISKILLDRTEEDMLYSLRISELSLNYDYSLKKQLEQLEAIKVDEDTRYTLIDKNGTVIADSDVDDVSGMENHLGREEVKEALKKGVGFATRKSETMKESMLYVACMSSNKQYILRLAIPFSGLAQYAWSFIPAVIISTAITLLVSVILANRFSLSVTRPLMEIAGEMHKLKEEKPEFHFGHYQYEEMNIIANTTMQMSKSVKESMDRIEFERMVRQEFFSNASHELKTPLTSVRGYIELLENDMATGERMKKDFLLRIKKETDNMTNLINDILMISRLETKEAEVILSEMRIGPLVKEIYNSLQPLAKEYQVTLDLNCKPLSIYANVQQIRELLNNLITNAIKYNKPNGTVNIVITSEGKDMVIVVEDTGVGIPEDAKQRIFERFYRVDKGRSKKVGGTGLGLSIVKHIVGYYNGTIELQSKVMEGTKFTVRLPMNLHDSKNN